MSAVDALGARISGAVAEPGSALYQATVTIDNGRAARAPAVVVLPRSTEDVALTLRFARDAGLPLTVKGGGHSAAGYSLNQAGVVLDMSLLKHMDLDVTTGVLRVQMGARWQDVYDYVTASGTGLIPVGGGCLPVGLPGFLLGGGYSFVSRSYGMGSDNVLSIDLVTADGEVHHLSDDASSDEDRDLWWACRGGGGGNFGVAVAMELQMQRPNTLAMCVGEVVYPLEHAEEVIGTYNDWVETVPDELAVYGFLGRQPDPTDPTRLRQAFRIEPVFNGAYADGMDILAPMLRLPAMSARLYEMTLAQWEALFGASTLVGGHLGYIRSGVMPAGGHTPEVIDIYRRFIGDAPSPNSFVHWKHAGGRISAIPDESSAVAHRDGRFVYELKCIWSDPVETRTNVEWAYEFGEALRPHFTGAYLNYIDPLLTRWKEMYYGDKYERLLRIKERVDPDRFFAFQQGIGSDFEPPTATPPLDLSPLNRTV